MKHYFAVTLLLLAILFSACEQVDESTDTSTNNSFNPNATNSCDQSEESTLGCFGEDLEFGDNEILDEGYWSLYAKRDNNLNYYDTYLFSYEFGANGYAQTLNKAQEFYVLAWGINTEGSKITIDHEGTITYKSIFTSDEHCYEISHSAYSETLKICHDDAVDMSHYNEGLGYYSETVSFGNYTYGDYTAAGTWVVSEYGTSTTQSSHTLNADGTTALSGKWGVSEDGKVLHVDNASYLISKYLNNGCLLCFDTQSSMTTPLQLCKN
jgi:hypothetical protein